MDLDHLVGHVVAGEDWVAAASLLDDRFFLAVDADADALLWLLGQIPERVLSRYPRMRLIRELRRDAALPAAGNAKAARARGGEDPRDILLRLLVRLRRLSFLGAYRRAEAVAQELGGRVRALRDADPMRGLAPVALLEAGIALLQAGRHERGMALLADAQRWACAAGHPAESVIDSHLELAAALAGRVGRAPIRDDDPDDEPRVAWAHPVAPLVRALRALAACEPSDLDADLIGRGVGDAPPDPRGCDRWWWVVAHLYAQRELLWGDADAAAEWLELTLRHGASRPEGTAAWTLHADLADLLQAVGDLAAASRVLGRLPHEVRGARVDASRIRLQLLLGDRRAVRLRLAAVDASSRLVAPEVAVLRYRAAAGAARHPADPEAEYEALLALLDRTGDLRALSSLPPALRQGIHPQVPYPYVRELPAPLTDREREVLRMLRGAGTVADLAAALGISPNTAKAHLRALYRKLGVSSREEALAMRV